MDCLGVVEGGRELISSKGLEVGAALTLITRLSDLSSSTLRIPKSSSGTYSPTGVRGVHFHLSSEVKEYLKS